MVPELRIIDKDFNLLGILDTYTSFQGERSLWEVGRLELHVDLRAQGADACRIGNIVMIDERRAWEITGVKMAEGHTLTLAVAGREVKGILSQRLVIPDEKDDSHHFGWDRKPNDEDITPYEQTYGESTLSGEPTATTPQYPADKAVYGTVLRSVDKWTYDYDLEEYVKTDVITDELSADGTITRRIATHEYDGSEDWADLVFGGETVGLFFVMGAPNDGKDNGAIICSHAWKKLIDPDDPNRIVMSGGVIVSFNYDEVGEDVTAFKSWVAGQKALGTPLTIWYELDTPVAETPLPPLPPPENLPTETIIKHYIGKHAITPIDGKRALPDWELAPDLKRGPETRWSERFRPLTETLKDIGEFTGLGYTVTVDLTNKRFLVDVIPEVDQTTTGDYPIILALDFENIEALEFANDVSSDVSIAYAGGAGEDEDRLIQTVARTPEDADLEGYDRKEAWLECGSVDDIDDLIYEAQYQLAQREKVETLTCQALPNTSFEYMKDWDLGSIVTVRSRALGLEQAQKITAVREVYERGRVQVIPTLGKRSKTILDEIRKVKAVD